MTSPWRARLTTTRLPAWVLLPLRLFLGITFVYAGLQKLTDPHFFRKGTPTYIGTQIAAFAHGTPLHGVLISLALPHAVLFGALIAYGELAIGLGTLIGLLMRPAAFFGLLLSAVFFLSASWRVYPYFYGADIVFCFGWITLLLAGPQSGGWPVLDARLAQKALAVIPAERRGALTRALAVVLGVGIGGQPPAAPATNAAREATDAKALSASGRVATRPAAGRPVVRATSRRSATVVTMGRRQLLKGVALGGGGMLVLVWLRSILFPDSAPTAPASTGATSTGATATPAASSTTSTASGAIGQVSQIQPNSAVTFTIPSNGDPGVLVHTQAGQFVAYDATCTHAGCPVQYDPSSQLLICPCHGAEFDPAHAASVVTGPTNTPLTGVPISVNKTTGAITLSQ